MKYNLALIRAGRKYLWEPWMKRDGQHGVRMSSQLVQVRAGPNVVQVSLSHINRLPTD